ncbi:MAG: ribulose-phosphate 3-epimerase [Patescibacteria group bacterium]|nr:ribulose-phosphate 3-epimerase [Patescibacteria group bacterium]
MKTILPGILTADIEEAKKHMESVGNLTDYFHVDIADGKFVNNTTFAVGELAGLGKFEIHLLAENPEEYFEDCKAAQAQRVIFHIESTENVRRVLEAAEEYPFEIGIAINPDTEVSSIVPFKEDIDSVMVMLVYPGFQGQAFIEEALTKVQQIKELASGMTVGVDGGVNEDTLPAVIKSGADYAIVGSGVFAQKNPGAALTKFKAMIH